MGIWCASWKVYTNALLGLVLTAPGGAEVPVVDFACLDEYVENFRNLVRDFPEAWHLNLQAEDRCRGDTSPAFVGGEQSTTWKGGQPGFCPTRHGRCAQRGSPRQAVLGRTRSGSSVEVRSARWCRLDETNWILGEWNPENAGTTWKWQACVEEAASDGSLTWH